MPQPSLPQAKRVKIIDLAESGKLSNAAIAKRVGVGTGTVSNILIEAGFPAQRAKRSKELHIKSHKIVEEGKSFSRGSAELKCARSTIRIKAQTPLPESWDEDHPAFHINGPARVLVMNDVHIPFHVTKAVEAAIAFGLERKANVIYLNGDIFDFHGVSRFPHDGTKLTYAEEIRLATQFMAHLRDKFPKARIIFKEGNHEERLGKYILARAEALWGLEKCSLATLCDFANHGVELVTDQRLVKLGKLNVIHGHEYGGGNSPVSAARWLILRTKANAMCGHLHQSSETSENTIEDESIVTWSVGCLCGLKPRYRRFNAKWQHGFAYVEVARDGTYHVDNRKFIRGRVA